MNYSISDKRFKYILYTIFLFVLIIVLNKPIQLFPDSDDYLIMSIIRSPTYPIFLGSIKAFFSNNFEVAIIVFQVLLSFFSINYFINNLKNNLNLNSGWLILLTIILLIPCVYNHDIANRILSEAVAYPLYLLVVSTFTNSFCTENNKPILYSFPILFLLILTRSQFVFLVPIGFCILLWISFKKKSFKKNSWIFLVFLTFPILTSTTDKGYHLLMHDHFVNTPTTGMHLITPAFYVADKEDISIFEDAKQQYFFGEIYNELENKKLCAYQQKVAKEDETAFYIANYSQIANHTVYDYGKNILGENLSKEEERIALDNITIKMAPRLIINNFKLWLKVYIKNFINAFGNSRYTLFFFILTIFSVLKLRRMPNSEFKCIALSSVLLLSNSAIVSLGMHTIKRFTFYNDWVIFLIIFILLDSFVKYKKKNES